MQKLKELWGTKKGKVAITFVVLVVLAAAANQAGLAG